METSPITPSTPTFISRDTFSAFTGKASRINVWPDPELSIGRYIGKVNGRSCWEAKGPARDKFDTIGPQIKEYLENSVDPFSSWVTWSIYMLGKTPKDASPIIFFCSEVAAHRKEVRTAVKDKGILDDHPGIRTGHIQRAPGSGRLVPLAGSCHVSSPIPAPATRECMVPSFNYNPCGMRLLVKEPSGTKPPRRATCGGIIQVRNRFYYTTVAHVFGPSGVAAAAKQQGDDVADDEVEIDGESDIDDGTEDETDDKIEEASLVPSDGFSGYSPGRVRVIATKNIRTQEVPRMSEATGSETIEARWHSDLQLGPPFLASSDDPPSCLDFSIIPVSHPAHRSLNKIGSLESQVKVKRIAVNGAKDTKILGATTRGVLSGSLSGTTVYSRLPGNRCVQEAFAVRMDSNLREGDCGSWIVDSESGDLYGHIVAGCPRSGLAMVMPFAPIFEDIKDRVGSFPRLPDRDAMFAAELYDDLDLLQPPTPCDTMLQLSPRSVQGFGEEWARDLRFRFESLVCSRRLHDARVGRQNLIRSRRNTALGSNQPHEDEPLPSYGEANNALPPPYRGSRTSLPLLPEPPSHSDAAAMEFRRMLITLSRYPLRYEDSQRLDEAVQVIPLNKIHNEADEESKILSALAESIGDGQGPEWGYEDCFIRALLRWFKRDFFTWVRNPPCSTCMGATSWRVTVDPSSDEADNGAARVELFECQGGCAGYERFPRYSNAWKLLETGRGRAGEWVNCFAMLCRAVGANVRWVWSQEDMVWLEVYSNHKRRWIHVDPCEEAFDNPRLYTEGE